VSDFAFAVIAAVLVGLAVGYVTVFVRSKLDDPVLDTALSIAVPFLAFLPAEAIGASGVLAVVVAGLYTGHASPTAFSAQSRLSDRINWRTIQFLLENGVFLLIGLELRTLIDDVDPEILGVGEAIGIGLLATLALVVIRFAWIVPLVFALRKRAEHAEKVTFRTLLALHHFRSTPVRNARERRMLQRAEANYDRRRADLEQLRRESIDWRGGIVLGWSGMRGVVTLAAAQSLPAATPYRPQLVLIAFTVAVVTLVVQGGTLPALIRLLRVRGVDDSADRRELAELLDTISAAGLIALDDPNAVTGTDAPVDPDVLERVRQQSYLRAEAAWERTREASEDDAMPHRLYRSLRLAVVDAEREKLLELRRLGAAPSRILAEAQALLDQEETRLRSRGGGRAH
jgi:CPA1 family monovalent cation:H+ antiporter